MPAFAQVHTPSRYPLLLLAAAAAVLLARSAFPASAQAPRGGGSFFVNSFEDGADANPGDFFCETAEGDCTLRAAVMELNAQAGTSNYIGLPPGEYSVDIPGAGEDDAATGDIDIHVSLQISSESMQTDARDGDDRGFFGNFSEIPVTILGSAQDRVFDVKASAAEVYFNFIRIRGGEAPDGQSGGAVATAAPVTDFYLVHFDSNDAEFGGAVAVATGGGAELEAVTASGGDALYGGALYVSSGATVELAYSTLNGNHADESGGAIDNRGTLTILNSTISSNSATTSGGGLFNTGQVTQSFATYNGSSAGSGGNIFTEAGGTTTTLASIVSGGGGGNCAGTGTFTSSGYNVEATNTCNFNQLTDEINANLLLGVLQFNGGPNDTHALLPTSAAIDQVAGASCVFDDQRNFSRPAPSGAVNCDAGAYEAGTAYFRVTTTADGPDDFPGDGYCSSLGECTLRAAIQEANALPGYDYVELPEDGPYRLGVLGPEEDLGATGDLDVTDDLIVVGALPLFLGARADQDARELAAALRADARGFPGGYEPTTVIDANGIDRVFDVLSGQVTLYGLAITEGSTAGSGGGVRCLSSAQMTIFLTELRDNAAYVGGGLYAACDVQMYYAWVRDNEATIGGGFFNDYEGQNWAALVVEGNTAVLGGGIYSQLELDLSLVSVHDNTAQSGGGIYNYGPLTATDLTIDENEAYQGAGLYNSSGGSNVAVADLNNVTIAHNEAVTPVVLRGSGPYSDAGGIYSNPGDTVRASNSIVAENTAATGPDCVGAITSEGFNLLGDSTGCGWLQAPGDVIDEDAGLGPLAGLLDQLFYFYPLTLDSPALDGGNPAIPGSVDNTCSESSFYLERPQGESCDMGAVEMALVDLEVEILEGGIAAARGDDKGVAVTVQNTVEDTEELELPVTLEVEFDPPQEFTFTPFDCEQNGGTVTCEEFIFEQEIEYFSFGLPPLNGGSVTITATVSVSELFIDTDPSNNTAVLTLTDEITPTVTETATSTPSATPSSTASATPSSTPTSEPTGTSTPSVTPSATATEPPGYHLFEGWNPVTWTGSDLEQAANIIAYLNENIDPPVWTSIAHYDEDDEQWLQTFLDAPLPSFNTLTEANQGDDYWLFVTDSALLYMRD